jgi:P-type Mg2+ transporter
MTVTDIDGVDAFERHEIALSDAANAPAANVLTRLDTTTDGLSQQEAMSRRAVFGPNAVLDHGARAWSVLTRQLRSPLLILLATAAVASFFLGQRTDAIIITLIVGASVGLGFVNEYRAERAAQALHMRIRHTATVIRSGVPDRVDVTELVPGDIVRLEIGGIVPADVRLLSTEALQCDEGVLTGESMPVDKSTDPVAGGVGTSELTSCALMGTVVRNGAATGVVVATGVRTEFGRIAQGLGTRQPETDFQIGLRGFSMLLLRVAGVLTTLIFATNLLLQRPLLEALLFSLAIAVGITPQLLPAVVSTSLAAGSRTLAHRRVLVKRLVCIEDLGDMDILVTDKTGTLTDGRINLVDAVGVDAAHSDRVLLLGLLCSEVDLLDGVPVGGNPLDVALWRAPSATSLPTNTYRRLGFLPFDHNRQMASAVVQAPDGSHLLVSKGAPESVLARCPVVPAGLQSMLDEQFAAGARVIAVACRAAGAVVQPTGADEHDLEFVGLLIFRDEAKPAAAASLRRLADLGITVKIATGDNPLVAEKVCADLGLHTGGTLTGHQIDGMDDEALTRAAEAATIFARVSPEHKARLIRLLRHRGRAVGFLGDGVNDALALHAADIGISVDTATDVAKDAADVVLLDKDLGVLADGVSEGRRIFANTIKYVLMGTSSNFGNMFSAAAASAVLAFLPMLPSQILLNNLLYDTSQLTIPTDNVDAEQLVAPSHWDIAFIRKFMLFFGTISSMFDFVTFAVMLGPFHAGPAMFRTGWFVESLATQTLVIFAVRTRRVPFLRSRPSWPLAAAALGVVAVGIVIPLSPVAGPLGFRALPVGFFAVLIAMIGLYLIMIELGKRVFFAEPEHVVPAERRRGRAHRVQRRASKFSHVGGLSRPGAGPKVLDS